MTSPLGKYAAIVAAITCVGVIGAYLVAVFAQGVGAHIDPISLADLKGFALLALGSVLGSAVVANGYKQPLASLGVKVDRHTEQITTLGAVAAEAHPPAAPVIAEVIKAPEPEF